MKLNDILKMSSYNINKLSDAELNEALLSASKNSTQRISRLEKKVAYTEKDASGNIIRQTTYKDLSNAVNSNTLYGNIDKLKRVTKQQVGITPYKGSKKPLSRAEKISLLKKNIQFLNLETSTISGVTKKIERIKQAIGVDVKKWDTDMWNAFKRYEETKTGTRYDSATEMAEFDELVEKGEIEISDDNSTIIEKAKEDYESKKQEEYDELKNIPDPFKSKQIDLL